MTNDIKADESSARPPGIKRVSEDAPADPVAVVLMLQQEAGNTHMEASRKSTPLKQAEIKERVLRRMLENSLESTASASRPHLKIVK
jgi:hypothetical protein